MNNPTQSANAPAADRGQKRRRKRPGGQNYRKRRGKQSSQVDDQKGLTSETDVAADNKSNNTQRSGSSNNSPGRQQAKANHGNQRKAGAAQKKRDLLPLYAALDLGTNNCRLLIAIPQQRGRFRVIDGFSRIVRLGEGLGATGRLSEDAMDRAIGALKMCARKLEARPVQNKRLIATEACRQAENGELFLQRVQEEAGLELEIVTREREAFLAAEGCGSLIDRNSSGAVLFDIGGGSSELVLVDRSKNRGRAVSKQIIGWTSLPLGVVTIAEQYGGKQVSRELYRTMVDHVVEEIGRFEGRNQLDHLIGTDNVHLLGTSGTVTTLAGLHLELPQYDRRKVDGLWMQDHQVDAAVERLLDMDFDERAANACIGTERADLVLAGCAILDGIRTVWPSKRLRVADRGLREGLLTEMMEHDKSWIRPKKARWSRKRKMKRNERMARQGGEARS